MPLVPQRGGPGVWEAEHAMLGLGFPGSWLPSSPLLALGQTGSLYSWPKSRGPQAQTWLDVQGWVHSLETHLLAAGDLASPFWPYENPERAPTESRRHRKHYRAGALSLISPHPCPLPSPPRQKQPGLAPTT